MGNLPLRESADSSSQIPESGGMRNALMRAAALLSALLALCFFLFFFLQLALATGNVAEGRIMAVKIPPARGAANVPLVSDFPHTGKYTLPTPVPILDYAFKLDGKYVQSSITVTKEQIRHLPQNDMIQVQYVGLNPVRWNRPILANDAFNRHVWALGLVTVCACIFAGILWKRSFPRTSPDSNN